MDEHFLYKNTHSIYVDKSKPYLNRIWDINFWK